MPLNYQSGEEIQAGDRIFYDGEPGHIEFVAALEDPESCWYVEEFGGGCMILVAPFGHLFLSNTAEDGKLEFISRDAPG
jgi:hypothetical protein